MKTKIFSNLIIALGFSLWTNTSASSPVERILDALERSVEQHISYCQEHDNPEPFFQDLENNLSSQIIDLEIILQINDFCPGIFTKCLLFQIKIGKLYKRNGLFLNRLYRRINRTVCSALAQELVASTDNSPIQTAQLISRLFWNFHSFGLLKRFQEHLSQIVYNPQVLSFILSFAVSKFKHRFSSVAQKKFSRRKHLQELIVRIGELFPTVELFAIDV